MKRFYYILLSLFELVAITISKKFHISRTFQGRKLSIDEVPYIVAVLNGPGYLGCTGCLVELRWVVTAAHCFDKNYGRRRVAVGTDNLYHPPEDEIDVKSVILHPKYQRNHWSTSIYDIALVELARCVKITKYVQLITFDNKGWPNNTSRRDCYVSGFGEHKKNQEGKLHGSPVTIGYGKFLDLRKCPFEYNLTDYSYWSYVDEGAGICFGDSGAPLVCDNIAVGVVAAMRKCDYSSLYVCEAKIIELYAVIYNASAWIQDNINNNTECDTSAMRPSSILTALFVLMIIL